MNIQRRLLHPFYTVLLISVCATSAHSSDYRLVWADEFNAAGPPDPENWTYERGFVRNNELQWYQSDNAYCTNGLLIVEARREKKINPKYLPESGNWRRSRKEAQYTSACLKTKGLHSWKYGRFEMRAKIRVDDGLWPAFWTLGDDGQWPGNGEIDIMEYYQGTLLANVAHASNKPFSPVWDSTKIPISTFPKNWSEQFHVWRMDWDKKSIKLFVDEQLLNETKLEKTFNPDGHSIRNPFHQPHYILVNLAIGGDQGGDPSKTIFPSRYEIDYVRVYQKP